MLKILCFLVSLGLASCATRVYSGTEADDERPASLKGHGVTIQRVDSQELGSMTSSVSLSPGPHKVWVTADASNYSMLSEAKKLLYLKVNLESGKRYVITSKRGSRRLCAFELSKSSSVPDFGKSAGCYQREIELVKEGERAR